MEPIKNKYDFVFIFDVKDGNPNGDPDAGNLPRVDPETGTGIVTDVCLKRKVRNYVELACAGQAGNNIFIKEKAVLNNLIDAAYETPSVIAAGESSKSKGKKDSKTGTPEQVDKAREYMCANYYDVRTFGAVMTTGKNAGQVRGPIQLTFARSVDPICSMEHCITRVAVTKPEDKERKETEMGRKSTVPYGLYVAYGFVSANFAEKTGFTEADLELFWKAMEHMFDDDHSAARGLMSARRLIVFKHDSKLGNASADKLFDRVKVRKNSDVDAPRGYSDYTVEVQEDNMPQGVSLIDRI